MIWALLLAPIFQEWSLHIRTCIAKANRMLGFLRRNCSRLTSMRCRRLLYLSLVRSHLSYGSELWAPQNSSNDLRRLEGVQRRATKFILQDYTSSYLARLKKTNLLPLSFGLKWKTSFSFLNASRVSLTLIPLNLCRFLTPLVGHFVRLRIIFLNLPLMKPHFFKSHFSIELFFCGMAYRR